MLFTLSAMAFIAATVGAISGLGGGIFIMPLLVQMFGEDYGPPGLAAVSLSVVLVNSLTSLFLGGQLRNVDFAFARSMAALSSIGALGGVWLQGQVNRNSFELYLAVLLSTLGVYIFWQAPKADAQIAQTPKPFQPLDGAFSLVLGAMASFFGIGGGVLQVPYMVYFRQRAVKQSTATSQVTLAVVAVVSLTLVVGIKRAEVPWVAVLTMSPAVVLGGLLGSRLSAQLRGPWIVRILALVLLFLAYRVSMRVLQLQG